MQLSSVLVAVVAVLLATTNALSAGDAKVVAPLDNIKSTRNVIRFLRSHDTVDGEKKNVAVDKSDDEERAIPKLDHVVSDLSENAVNAAKKLTRTKSLSSPTIDEEIVTLKNFYKNVKAGYMPVFKDFAVAQKITPKQAADKLDIWKKLKTMSMDELNKDANFHFWKEYTRYWNTYHFSTPKNLDRLVSDLSGNTVSGTKALTRSKSLSSATIDDDIDTLKRFYTDVKANYMPVFKDFAVAQKITPKQAADKLDIWKKLKTMSMDELNKDANFHFWKEYTRYWNKYHFAE